MDTILLQEMQSYVNRNRSDNEVKATDHFKWLDKIHEPKEQVNVSDIVKFEIPQKTAHRETPKLLPGEENRSFTTKNDDKIYHTKNGDTCRRKRKDLTRKRATRYGNQMIPEILLRLNKDKNIQTIEW